MEHHIEGRDYDAVIIGGRAAGAATAMLLARAGAKVLVVERDPEIGDTLSTHALMRPGVTMLARWGLLDEAAQSAPVIRTTEFNYGGERLEIPVKPSFDTPGLFAPRRWKLDRTLAEAARAAGAEFVMGSRCEALLRNALGRVTGVVLRNRFGNVSEIAAGLVIGADGRMSTVAEAAGAQVIASSEQRSATIYGYFDGLPDRGYQWYYGEGVAAGLIPTTGGQHCLFTSCKPSDFVARFRPSPLEGMARILRQWEPGHADAILAAGPAEKLRAYTGAPGFIRDCAGDGWALVGDAGYFKDPASAHGLSDAFLDAERLSSAIISGRSLGEYQYDRDLHASTMFLLTQRMATLDCGMDELKSIHRGINACMKRELTNFTTETTLVDKVA